MKQSNTNGIVLARINYGEADRIITVITDSEGKVRLLVRGARKEKSKLAGGIEFFSVCQLTFIHGRGDIGTLTSSRLITHYSKVVEDLDRTLAGYEMMKKLHRVTEDSTDASYFNLLESCLSSLDNKGISLEIIREWFAMQIIRLDGQEPNLTIDSTGKILEASSNYTFNFDNMVFDPNPKGHFNMKHIKLMRLGFGEITPITLQKIDGIDSLWSEITPLVETIYKSRIRL